jgi:hypothetical protein
MQFNRPTTLALTALTALATLVLAAVAAPPSAGAAEPSVEVAAVPSGFESAAAPAAGQRIEISDDALERVVMPAEAVGQIPAASPAPPAPGTAMLPYGTAPDWDNTGFRVQVGGLAVADLELDGDSDLVVGCYQSQSFPPYDDWRNFIYFNTGYQLEAMPSWASDDARSTGDIHVALIDADPWPDVVAGNGGFSFHPSVIYFGSSTGPSTTPGWLSADTAWTNYALPFDVDHDGDVDLVTANPGNAQNDPFRPIYMFVNDEGTLPTTPGWQSAETSIQNFLDFADYDGNDWEDLAVAKWANFETGIYANTDGALATTPVWTTGDTDTDRGVGWADLDGNGDPDLAIGADPTRAYTNVDGTLTATWSASGTFFGHQDLRWADVDRDGDPDLAEIHFSNGVVNIYLNHRDTGGTLESVPSWSYDSGGAGTAVAFGDIDGDHWPDLVVGNSGDPSVLVFYNRLGTLFSDGFESGDLSAWSSSVP